MRFQPEHFPIGTQFTINKDVSWNLPPDTVFTVKEVRQNGPRSYVLETGVPHFTAGEEIITHSFNTVHVNSIVKRGDGPCVVSGRTVDKNKHFRELATHDHSVISHTDFKRITGKTLRKKQLAVLDGPYFVEQVVVPFVPSGHLCDSYRLYRAALDAGVVLESQGDRQFFRYLTVIDLPRLKRFIRRNINRFLTSLDAEEKILEDEYNRSMEDLDCECELSEDEVLHD